MRKVDKHKKTHTRHPSYKKKVRTVKPSLEPTQVLEVVDHDNEVEIVKEDVTKEEAIEALPEEPTIEDSSLPNEKQGLTGKISLFVKNQKEQHHLEKQEKLDRIQEAKNAKQEHLQILKDKKAELKETKRSIKQAKKELKAAKKQNKGLLSAIIILLFSLLAVFLFFVVNWLFKTWPNLQMSELVYEATAPLEGTGSDQITNFIQQAVVPTSIVFVLVLVIIIFLSHASTKVRRRGKQIITILSCVCLFVAGFRFFTKLDVGTYLQSQTTSSDFIETNYVDPSSTEITFPETKRNLVMIYLESMEMTYADNANGGGFEENYIPELTELAEQNETFSDSLDTLNGGNSLSYTTWTIAGLFASSSGLPLQITLNDNNDMDTQESFFPGIVTLGDLLEEQGYHNVFACGSNATFGGRRLYFSTHGNYECHDINYRKENGQLDEDYYVWWGFEDSKLIEWAKEDLTSLAESDQPFNYTMLTVDTHFEDGYVCDLCEDRYDGNQYANVISCSSRQVSELVSWIQEQDWYENTTIVLTGDHPTMDSDFCNPVSEEYNRRVYTAYINAEPAENNSEGMRTYSTFDTFPTVVASLGASIQGERLGLGTNLFSGDKTLTEQLSIKEENAQLNLKSEFMEKISGVDMEGSAVREREGISTNTSVNLDRYEDQIAHFTVNDIYNTVGTLQSIEMTLTDSSGNTETKQMEYQGDGSFAIDLNIPDGNIDSVYLKVEVITSKDEEEVREVSYEYSGPLWLMGANQSSLSNYLEDLQNLDKNRYTIFMTMQAETGENLNEQDRQLLSDLGASSLVDGGGNASFAVISNEEVYTRSGNEYIRDNSYLESGVPFVIASSANELQTSSILIGWDYAEYCPQGNGINIVVWDNENYEVVKQSVFDCNTLAPTATITTKTTLLSKNVTLLVEDLENAEDIKTIVAVIYDPEDISNYEELTMSLNEDDQYERVLKNYKEAINKKTIKIYAAYGNSRKYIGTLENKSN